MINACLVVLNATSSLSIALSLLLAGLVGHWLIDRHSFWFHDCDDYGGQQAKGTGMQGFGRAHTEIPPLPITMSTIDAVHSLFGPVMWGIAPAMSSCVRVWMSNRLNKAKATEHKLHDRNKNAAFEKRRWSKASMHEA